MSEYLLVPAKKLHKSEILSLSQLALVETLCIGAHAVHRACNLIYLICCFNLTNRDTIGVRDGERVVVVGAGPVGMAVTQFSMAAAGATGNPNFWMCRVLHK